MPYIVATTTRIDHALNSVTRIAAATLDEAREAALSAVLAAERSHPDPERVGTYSELDQAARDLPEQGGTVGPLPNRTLIEVTPATYETILGQVPIGHPVWFNAAFQPPSNEAILAAFNASQ